MSARLPFLDNPPAYRLPAGVRLHGRGVGGQWVTVDLLPVYVDEVTDDGSLVALLEFAEREEDRAARQQMAVERKFQDDPRRYAADRANAEAAREFWSALADQAIDRLTPEGDDEEVTEWEVGIAYDAISGRSSDVDVNFRIRREDGRRMGRAEAERALREFREGVRYTHDAAGAIPLGYQMAGVQWRNPSRGTYWRPHGGLGGVGDLENFTSIFIDLASNDAAWSLRLGSVGEYE